MAKKEYLVSDLQNEARLAWVLDDEPEPDVRVFVKDGKAGAFISRTSGIQGLPTGSCVSIGEPFTYDEAYVLEFDTRGVKYLIDMTCFLALGRKGCTTIYAIEAYRETPLIKDAPSMQEAMRLFGERIGLSYVPWKNLLTPPEPTWERMEYTPERVSSLKPYQVFVFGSNREGNHWAGAAKQAFDEFGAVWGEGEGLFGQSYALPTMGLSLKEIEAHVDTFTRCAQEHPDLEFLVTRVGCGIAGFKDRDIAPLFAQACLGAHNITLPKSFNDIIGCILRGEEY